MEFDLALKESVKAGYKRLATATKGSSSPAKVKNYLNKLDKEGEKKKIEKEIKKKGLTGKHAEAYEWAIKHKMLKGHFN